MCTNGARQNGKALDHAYREPRAKLDRLADLTQRSKSFLAAKALDTYAERELEKFERIEAQLRATPDAPDPDADEIFAIMERASRNGSS